MPRWRPAEAKNFEKPGRSASTERRSTRSGRKSVTSNCSCRNLAHRNQPSHERLEASAKRLVRLERTEFGGDLFRLVPAWHRDHKRRRIARRANDGGMGGERDGQRPNPDIEKFLLVSILFNISGRIDRWREPGFEPASEQPRER